MRRSPRIRPLQSLEGLEHACDLVAPIAAQPQWQEHAIRRWGCLGLGIFPSATQRLVPQVDPELPQGFLLLACGNQVPEGSQSPRPSEVVVIVLLHPGEYAPEPTSGDEASARQLVQSAAALVAARGGTALEMRGSSDSGSCELPGAALLQSCGFMINIPHPLHPVLRLEIRRTRTWAVSLGAAIGWVREFLRPVPPEPATQLERVSLGEGCPRPGSVRV